MMMIYLLLATLVLANFPPPELGNNVSCLSAGLPPDLLAYRRSIRLLTSNLFIPVYMSNENDTHTATRAVVWLHGLVRDANSYFCDGFSVLSRLGAQNDTISLAPWFGSVQVSENEWGAPFPSTSPSSSSSSPLSFFSAYWDTNRWLEGGDSSPSKYGTTTSFDVLDAVTAWLRQSAAVGGAFPNLRQIIFVGFSAGGQIASRWSLFTPYGTNETATREKDIGNMKNEVKQEENVPIRWIIGDGGSYLYLDSRRPAPSCSPLFDTTTAHSCGIFVKPPETISTVTTEKSDGGLMSRSMWKNVDSTCPDYDVYKYGLQNLSKVRANTYLAPFAADPSKLATAVINYLQKDVRFLLGDQDVCNCNAEGGYKNPLSVCFPPTGNCTPDTTGGTFRGATCCDTFPDDAQANALDVHCAAMLQGSSRLQRGINYVDYLEAMYRDYHNKNANYTVKSSMGASTGSTSSDRSGSSRRAIWPLMQFFRGGHSNQAMYNSSTFRQWVLND